MYGAPPSIADASVALAAGSAAATAIAAPGAGFRIRVVGGMLMITRSATGNADVVLRNGVGGSLIAQARGLTVAGTPIVPLVIPEPGVVLDENTLLELSTAASAAAGAAQATIYYFIDSI